MCWAQQRPLMAIVKDMLWPLELWVSPTGGSWGLESPLLTPMGLHCPSCPRTDPGTLHRRRGKGTGYLRPQGAELTHKPSPFLHPGPPRSVPWPSAISSGHEMWHSVTHASPRAEPSDTRPPRSCSDVQSVWVWCALEILACWRLSAAGAGSCPPLPAGSHVPAELLCPGPTALSCHNAFINHAFPLQ